MLFLSRQVWAFAAGSNCRFVCPPSLLIPKSQGNKPQSPQQNVQEQTDHPLKHEGNGQLKSISGSKHSKQRGASPKVSLRAPTMWPSWGPQSAQDFNRKRTFGKTWMVMSKKQKKHKRGKNFWGATAPWISASEYRP